MLSSDWSIYLTALHMNGVKYEQKLSEITLKRGVVRYQCIAKHRFSVMVLYLMCGVMA